ncbi:MAG TPA: hypothetical protein VK559_11370 [Ferruginibacter sp.]|nr:hypothetical protein [Ferruginibacter sp.]
MSEKELKEFKTILRVQRTKVRSSKVAARKLLNELGMLTPKGNLKKSFTPTIHP